MEVFLGLFPPSAEGREGSVELLWGLDRQPLAPVLSSSEEGSELGQECGCCVPCFRVRMGSLGSRSRGGWLIGVPITAAHFVPVLVSSSFSFERASLVAARSPRVLVVAGVTGRAASESKMARMSSRSSSSEALCFENCLWIASVTKRSRFWREGMVPAFLILWLGLIL